MAEKRQSGQAPTTNFAFDNVRNAFNRFVPSVPFLRSVRRRSLNTGEDNNVRPLMLTSVQTASAEAWQEIMRQLLAPVMRTTTYTDGTDLNRHHALLWWLLLWIEEEQRHYVVIPGPDHTTHANRTSGMKMHTPTVSARSLHFRVYQSHQQPNFVVDDDNTHDSASAIRQTMVVRNGPLHQ